MDVKRALTCALMNRLPARDQAQMVADVIAWRFADLAPAERQEMIEQLGPGLIEMMCDGRLGLPLLIHFYLTRLPPLRWLKDRAAQAEALPGPQSGRLAPRPPQPGS